MGDVQTEALTFEKVWALLQESLQASREENDRRWAEQRKLEAERREEEAERWAKETKRREEESERRRLESEQRRLETEKEAKRHEEEAKRREEEAKQREQRREEEEAKRRAEEAKRREEEEKKYQKEMKELNKKMGYLDNRFGELAEHLVAPNIQEKFKALGFTFNWVFPKPFTLEHPINKDVIAEIDILLLGDDSAVAIEVKAKADQKDVDKHKERMEVLRYWLDSVFKGRKLYGAIAGAIMTEEVKRYAIREGFYAIVQSGDTVKIDVPEGFSPKSW